jgi:arginine utilization protein RocB
MTHELTLDAEAKRLIEDVRYASADVLQEKVKALQSYFSQDRLGQSAAPAARAPAVLSLAARAATAKKQGPEAFNQLAMRVVKAQNSQQDAGTRAIVNAIEQLGERP